MRALCFLGGGILIGVGVSWAEAYRRAQIAAAVEVEEQVEIHKRVIEKAAEKFLAEGPHETETDLDGPDNDDDAIRVGGEIVVETKLSDVTPGPDYLKHAREYHSGDAVSMPEAQVEYISEDTYHEEDGRAKEQILIHMGEDEPLFVNEGVVVENWKELVSPNILVDMYQMLPPGTPDRALYVRNHVNHTDYEVIQEIP